MPAHFHRPSSSPVPSPVKLHYLISGLLLADGAWQKAAQLLGPALPEAEVTLSYSSPPTAPSLPVLGQIHLLTSSQSALSPA